MKINLQNDEKLNKAIDAVESRARARCISAHHIQSSVKQIETTLRHMLHKKDWSGVRFEIDPNAQSFPSSYKGTPESTQVIVERFPSGWFVIGLGRDICKGTEVHPCYDWTQKAASFTEFASNARSWN